jgi:Fe-S-cluster containining protein
MNLPVLNCDDCGACCSRLSLPPFIPSWEPDGERETFFREHPVIAAELQAEVDRRTRERDWTDEGPCFWLDCDTKRCRHYEVRPEICCDLEMGGESCLEWRKSVHYQESQP